MSLSLPLKQCELCGAEFQPNRMRPDQKFHSMQCAQRAADLRKKARRLAAAASKPKVLRKCCYEPCRLEFVPYHAQRFHSNECRNRFHAPESNAQRRKRYANDPNYRQRHLAEATFYYKEHRDKVRARNRVKQPERTEYARKWRAANPERAKALNARGHDRLRAKLLEYEILRAKKLIKLANKKSTPMNVTFC